MRGLSAILLAAALAALAPAPVLAQYDTVWVRQVSRPPEPGHLNRANDMYVDASGVYACGMIQDHQWNVHVMGVVKYDSLGDSLWYNGHSGNNWQGENVAYSFVPGGGARSFLIGSVDRVVSGVDVAWSKLENGSGGKVWPWPGTVCLDWPGDDVLFDAVVGGDGGLYACGTKWNNAAATNEFLVVKIDTADGDTLWTRSYHVESADKDSRQQPHTFGAQFRAHRERRGRGGSPPQDRLPDFYDLYADYENCATAIATSPDGNIVVTGFGYDDTAYETEMWTMKLEPDGDRVWERTHHYDYQGGYEQQHDADAAFDVAVATDGNVYVCGRDYAEDDHNLDQDYNFAVVAYNSAGTKLASVSRNGNDDEDCATALCLDNANPQNVYTTGWVWFNTPREQMVTHKLSHSLGTLLWGANGARYGGNDTMDFGYDICYQGGRVYVTGAAGPHIPVVCYTDVSQSPKNPLWAFRYRHPDGKDNIGSSISVRDSNHIYFTGQSFRTVGLGSWSSIPIGRLMYVRRDVAATKIIEPVGAKGFNSVHAPRVEVKNLGNAPATFTVRFDISDGYTSTQSSRLALGQTDTLDFPSWTADSSGLFATRCTVSMAGDTGQANNWLVGTVGVLPPAPLPQAPGNGAVLTTLQPLLQVADGEPDAVDGFHFRLYQDSLVRESYQTGTTWTVAPPVYNGRSYTWDCQAHSAGGWGPYFSPRRDFSIVILPGVPLLSSPVNGSDVATLTPELFVRKLAPDIEKYHFRVYQADSLVREDSVADTTWVIGPALYNGRAYRWECRARNAAGWGTYSGQWTFNVRVLPATPVPQRPGNGATVYTLTPELEVGAIPDADRYHFRVYEGGSLVVENSQVTTPVWTVSQALVGGHTYTWDCRAHNIVDWGDYFSPRWSFVVSALPAPPNPLAPAQGGDIATLTPQLEVEDMGPPVDRYHFKVYEGSTLVAENTNAGRTWTVGPGLENGRTYNWEAAAHNPAGWGDFFDPNWTFNTRVLPELPLPQLPPRGSVVPVYRPTLEVGPVGDAIHYHFQLFDTEADALVTEATVGVNTWTVDLDLVNGERYWWQCRVENVAGWGGFFAPRWDFTVGVLPAAPVALLPDDGTEVFTRVPLLHVGRVEDAVDYHYQVYDSQTDALVAEGTAGDTCWTVSPALGRNRTYWWQCRCRNVAGWGAWFAPRWSFEVSRFDPWPVGWHEVEPVPKLPSGREVKDGAWLALHADTTLYAAKGYKTGDFFRYEPLGDSWSTLESIPAGEDGKNKPPKKGSAGAAGSSGCVYMVKGNNTLGFWRYDIAGNTWHRLPGVPAGPDGKNVKGGTDLVYVEKQDTGWAYLLKGYRNEFYRYNVPASRWDTMPDVPRAQSDRFKPGSFLAFDGESTIYCHQAAYSDGTNHFMYLFDVHGDTWCSAAHKGMPLYGQHGTRVSKKKSKDGAAGAWFGGRMYALKGGNTQQFFSYRPAGDSWAELETIPSFGSTQKRKRVKAGGDVLMAMNALWALKGNKTLEFWRYGFDLGQARTLTAAPQRSGLQAGPVAGPFRVAVLPNPLAGRLARVVCAGLKPGVGALAVTVFDVAGRTVLAKRLVSHSSAVSVPLDLSKLAPGVYLVVVDQGQSRLGASKLVVE